MPVVQTLGKRNKQTRLFIAVEGIDGAGKSTLIEGLVFKFKDLGFKVYRAQDPGTTIYGQAIRQVIKTNSASREAQALAFLSARYETIRTLYADFLADESDKVIFISDRYEASTAIFQKFDTDLICRNIYQNVRHLLDFPTPDIYLFLDVEFEESCRRRNIRQDSNASSDVFEKEMEKKACFDELRAAYANLNLPLLISGSYKHTKSILTDTTNLQPNQTLNKVWEKLENAIDKDFNINLSE